ncbi:hypothetical protein N072000002_09240 [Clostridium tetani]|uniref:Uncharacterized protein n=1 Tax=Clostridium tetani TaxID=1513 RepID=A0ABC8EBS1_CLOTA|nr:hypothetical protein [Clostridium tetani]YP_009217907.1 hypothetical protein phiCT453B_11 [Clostridium phage phiCT453B]AJA42563.1 hypothetical protein phiCT453B_11 [Clostridium phage phiCT453B]KGI45288.1 hypothetical protein KY55_01220 [Clostridium tetani]BDR66696.1 hypothetical protein K144312032_09240 [Clostridium tetani]BDR80667.1 hypothetical protein K234311028_09130 [Clostridium tetani]BDR89123.1 hypothetical protein N072000002_09240 [Clostridium tetani]
MNKRQIKKLAKKQEVTKEDAQKAWNIVARYLNTRPEISFYLTPWGKEWNERKYSIGSIDNTFLVADTEWDKYSNYKMGW